MTTPGPCERCLWEGCKRESTMRTYENTERDHRDNQNWRHTVGAGALAADCARAIAACGREARKRTKHAYPVLTQGARK